MLPQLCVYCESFLRPTEPKNDSQRIEHRWQAKVPHMPDVRNSLEQVFRREYGRIIASLIRLCGDFDLAEDVLQDAFVQALDRWAERGIPDNPAAWLTT